RGDRPAPDHLFQAVAQDQGRRGAAARIDAQRTGGERRELTGHPTRVDIKLGPGLDPGAEHRPAGEHQRRRAGEDTRSLTVMPGAVTDTPPLEISTATPDVISSPPAAIVG